MTAARDHHYRHHETHNSLGDQSDSHQKSIGQKDKRVT